jgi:hypothetical protein
LKVAVQEAQRQKLSEESDFDNIMSKLSSTKFDLKVMHQIPLHPNPLCNSLKFPHILWSVSESADHCFGEILLPMKIHHRLYKWVFILQEWPEINSRLLL